MESLTPKDKKIKYLILKTILKASTTGGDSLKTRGLLWVASFMWHNTDASAKYSPVLALPGMR